MRHLARLSFVCLTLVFASLGFNGRALAQEMTFAPDPLNFANQVVGTSSAPSPVTVTNVGGANLTVTAVALATGTQFSISSEDCTTSPIAPAGTCTINVVFSPTASGLQSDTVNVTSNAVA